MGFAQTIKGFFKDQDMELRHRSIKAWHSLINSGCADYVNDFFEMFPEAEGVIHPVHVYDVATGKCVDKDVTEMLEKLAEAKLIDSSL